MRDRLVHGFARGQWHQFILRACDDKGGDGDGAEQGGAVRSSGHAFAQQRFHRVEAITEPRNQRSRQLLERHGFTLEGVQRENYLWNGEFMDSAVYSLLTHATHRDQIPQ